MPIDFAATIPPGSVIAILGGGQLGAMLCEAARHMGYRTLVVSESSDDPAARWADEHAAANPSDAATVVRIARRASVLTVEFEGIEPAALEAAANAGCKVSPSPLVQTTARDRRLEKNFLRENNFAVGPFRIVESAEEMLPAYFALANPIRPAESAAPASPIPVVAKTARGGYDGKGQQWLRNREQAVAAWELLGQIPLVLEQAVPFVAEASVIVARSSRQACTVFPVFRNEHRNGILFQTVCPAGFSESTEREARLLAEAISQKLGVIGLLAVEMFVLADGRVLVNELAARPHNSGHLSLRACTRSQFEMHIAAICNLPLPPVELLAPAVMTNLLGDLWHPHPPNFNLLHADERATLHLYGKTARVGRKMGHMIHTAETPEMALSNARRLFEALSKKS